MLEMNGVPTSRAKSVANGIEVLTTRFRKADHAAETALTEANANHAAEMEHATGTMKHLQEELTDSRRVNAQLREAVWALYGRCQEIEEFGNGADDHLTMQQVSRAMNATSADHKAWEDSVIDAAANEMRERCLAWWQTFEYVRYSDPLEAGSGDILALPLRKPKGGA